VSWGIEFDAGLWAPAAAALLVAVFAAHARLSPARSALMVLRAGAVAALALTLLRPTVLIREGKLVKPRLLILLDSGHGMGGKTPGADTRLGQATKWLKQHRREIERRAEASVTLVSDRARLIGGLDKIDAATLESTPFKPERSLPDAVATEGPPARVWLITDGVVEAGGDFGLSAAALGAPIDTLGVGPSRRETGASFLDLRAPDFAFLHDRIPVEVNVEATGLGGRDAVVTLSRADENAPGGWREVDRAARRLQNDLESFSVKLSVPADALGTTRLRLGASGGGRERLREFRVETVRQKYRIMYLAGRPSAEYAALREFLKADPNHELVSFVILRNPENPSPAPDRELSLIPFPVDEIFGRALPQFDLFILENFSAARFRLPPPYLEALKRFVSNGGALLVKGGDNAFFAGGYKNSPLEEALPVVLSSRSPDFVPGLFVPKAGPPEHPLVRLYETGELSRRAWEALPPLDGWGRFASVRPGAAVLAAHPSETTEDGKPLPIAAVRSFGRGKVMMISTDSSWRWKLGAAADPDAADFYARFWTRAVQYLTGSLDLSKVKFAPLPDRVTPREPARLSLRVFDDSFGPALAADTRLSVTWTAPDGRVRDVAARETEPGAYAIELTGLTPGSHRVRASAFVRGRAWGSDEIRFLWETAREEPMDRAWLTKAAAAGGGIFVDLSSARPDQLLDLLPPARPRDEMIRRWRPFAAPVWLFFTGLLFLLEWALRRRFGHA
jgi:uncharacterized membrane protein